MSFFYMMDDLRYFFLSFFFFFSFLYGGGGGWSSSRWLFGTQFGLGSRSVVGGRAALCGGRLLQKQPTTTALATVVSGSFEATDFLFQ